MSVNAELFEAPLAAAVSFLDVEQAQDDTTGNNKRSNVKAQSRPRTDLQRPIDRQEVTQGQSSSESLKGHDSRSQTLDGSGKSLYMIGPQGEVRLRSAPRPKRPKRAPRPGFVLAERLMVEMNKS